MLTQNTATLIIEAGARVFAEKGRGVIVFWNH